MAGITRIQLYVRTVATIVILLAASEATEAHLMNLCDQTAYPELCRPLVKEHNPRRATHNMILVLESKTRMAIADAARFKHGNNAVEICYSTLSDAAFHLGKARETMRKRNVLSLTMFLNGAVSDYGVCVDACIESHQVNRVQHAADELRKIGTNCLALATMIN